MQFGERTLDKLITLSYMIDACAAFGKKLVVRSRNRRLILGKTGGCPLESGIRLYRNEMDLKEDVDAVITRASNWMLVKDRQIIIYKKLNNIQEELLQFLTNDDYDGDFNNMIYGDFSRFWILTKNRLRNWVDGIG